MLMLMLVVIVRLLFLFSQRLQFMTTCDNIHSPTTSVPKPDARRTGAFKRNVVAFQGSSKDTPVDPVLLIACY